MASADLGDMTALLGDPEVMTYYPRPKTRQEAAQWIDWNRRLYRTRRYGLWLLAPPPATSPGTAVSPRRSWTA
jgi:RimJ/RimL family protein N-acetyltransferase